jgi:cysteine synthase
MNEGNNIDSALLEHFEREIWSKVPHLENNDGSTKVVNATPLVDITEDFKECAKSVFKLNLDNTDLKVFGKLDSTLLTGSIKVRPAANIIHDAIITGKLKSGQTVIEATSGNFGIALGLLSKLGLNVIALVSRKLQEGVFEGLKNGSVRTMDLDMDICPAPGMEGKQDLLIAKATASNVRSQLSNLGFNTDIFDKEISEIESLLAKQDIINLAKFLAKIYGFFCPEQYDNQLNVDAHRTITAAEIDQQLHETGDSLENFNVYCTFGTGGTSSGLSNYFSEKYGKKSVYVIFPPSNQDVAGIRTKANADGLKYYKPEIYAGQQEMDWEKAKLLLKFFVDKGHDMGESSALELYAILQKASADGGGKFVAMICDGIEKYKKNLASIGQEGPTQVSLQEAVSKTGGYDKVIWIHAQYTPREEGIELLAKSLGVDKSKISVPDARITQELLATQQIPDALNKDLESDGKPLLVCMAGKTSLMAAKVLAGKGVITDSLIGGITQLPEGQNKQLSDLIKEASHF